eukprot:scaffold92565_cov86-Phaeocystis_antarctica.AAC.1
MAIYACLVAEHVLPRVHARAPRVVLDPFFGVVPHAKLQRVLHGEARPEHDSQVGSEDICAVLLRLGEALHPLVGAPTHLVGVGVRVGVRMRV